MTLKGMFEDLVPAFKEKYQVFGEVRPAVFLHREASFREGVQHLIVPIPTLMLENNAGARLLKAGITQMLLEKKPDHMLIVFEAWCVSRPASEDPRNVDVLNAEDKEEFLVVQGEGPSEFLLWRAPITRTEDGTTTLGEFVEMPPADGFLSHFFAEAQPSLTVDSFATKENPYVQ